MIDKFLNLLSLKVEESGNTYIPFAIYGLINYLTYYPWSIWARHTYAYPYLYRHLFNIALCIVLLLRKYWPQKIEKYFSLYFYCCILFTLPYSTTYTFLLTHADSGNDSIPLLNIMLTLFLLFFILDWVSLFIVLFLGICLGLLAFYIVHGTPNSSVMGYQTAFYIFAWTIMAGILFSRNISRARQNYQLRKQLTAVRTVCASIAHELRTPLLSIKGGANGIKIFIPRLLAGYKAAAEAKLDIPRIFPGQIKQIEQVIDNIESEVNFSNTVIDTLLLNATQIAVNPKVYTSNSMSQCIKAALLRYPFNPSEQLDLVHFTSEHDFTYHGDDLLMTHVIFNLLKNALYAIAEMQKGDIFIWLSNAPKYNYLHFKDTAKGITKEEQERLFEPFNSNTPVGTGIGLSFCRMVMQNLGGDIELHTKAGDYAEFVLKFPKVEGKS